MTNTILNARLKIPFIAANVVKDSNRDKVKYSIQNARTPTIMKFLRFLYSVSSKPRPWDKNRKWPLKKMTAPRPKTQFTCKV